MRIAKRTATNCGSTFRTNARPTGRVCCIPLAVIRDYVYCEPLTEAMIDNSIRPGAAERPTAGGA